MQVIFKRPFFSTDGVLYPARQIVEVADDMKLPKDAERVNVAEELPSDAPPTLPGYGGKPLHDQALDQIGAAPSRLIVEVSGTPREPDEAADVADKDPKSKPERDPKEVPSAKDTSKSKDSNVKL